jgi:hypothetical protein
MLIIPLLAADDAHLCLRVLRGVPPSGPHITTLITFAQGWAIVDFDGQISVSTDLVFWARVEIADLATRIQLQHAARRAKDAGLSGDIIGAGSNAFGTVSPVV